MLRRVWKAIRLTLAAAVVASPAAAAAPPEQPARIVAMGDLHGDFETWRRLAGAAGLVDRSGRWTGGKATLVQVGDVVDRGPGSLNIVRDLMRLQKESAKQGGRVIVLVGNHEAMNILGDLRYVTPGEFAAYASANSAAMRDRLYQARKAEIEAGYRAKDPAMSSAAIRAAWTRVTPPGWVEHRLAWATDGEIGRWVIRNPAVALVGGNLFVHGGISAEYAKLSLAEMNRQVAAALAAVDRSPASIISDPLGPLWYRGLVTRDGAVTEIPAPAAGAAPRPSIEQELATVLAAYGARRIVVGHTPSRNGIQIQYGGRLVRIDSGNSSHYGGTPAYLEIVGDRVTAHPVPRAATASGGKQ